jgi:hypothetical protein
VLAAALTFYFGSSIMYFIRSRVVILACRNGQAGHGSTGGMEISLLDLVCQEVIVLKIESGLPFSRSIFIRCQVSLECIIFLCSLAYVNAEGGTL